MMKLSFLKSLNGEEYTTRDKLIDLVMYNPLVRKVREIIRFIKRLSRWVPVLYKQMDFDYEGIYDLIEQKIKDLRNEILKDKWHNENEVKREIRQIDVCLSRLDRYRNWTEYYEYPTDDIKYLKNKDGFYQMKHFSEVNEKQRLGACNFENKNYNKFWKDFLKWHQSWWT